MAILKIARMGHPVLNRPADVVADPGAPEIARLVDDMMDTLDDAQGAGLAAPQVHVPLRVVIFFAPNEDDDEDEDDDGAAQGVPLTVLINPVIEPLGEARSNGWEACLSVPGLTGLVPRWEAVRYRGLTLDGRTIEREATGFHARVVQHECDHLDGIVYPMRMTNMTQLMFCEERRHYVRAGIAAQEDEEPVSEEQ
jgi:peptide deformylase